MTAGIAKRQRKTRKEWAVECRRWRRKTIEGLIGLGKTLRKAKDDLDHGEWLPFLRDDLRIDESFARRLMKIARDPRLSNQAHWPDLPTALRTLLLLRSDRLSDADYEAGKASGAINKRTTEKQARVLVRVTNVPLKILSVAYVGPTETFKGWGVGGRRHAIEPVPPERHANEIIDAPQPPMVSRPSDPLIADLAHVEEQLHERLDGDRLKMALSGLEQIRKAIEPTRNVVPLSRPS
jgi:hypothetical protein